MAGLGAELELLPTQPGRIGEWTLLGQPARGGAAIERPPQRVRFHDDKVFVPLLVFAALCGGDGELSGTTEGHRDSGFSEAGGESGRASVDEETGAAQRPASHIGGPGALSASAKVSIAN